MWLLEEISRKTYKHIQNTEDKRESLAELANILGNGQGEMCINVAHTVFPHCSKPATALSSFSSNRILISVFLGLGHHSPFGG